MDGGSGGVLLIELNQHCVALKGQGLTAAQEMLAESVAEELKTPVAKTRIVRRGESEYQNIIDGIAGCSEFGSYQYRPYLFGVLEFVRGHTLMGEEGHHVMLEAAEGLLTSLGRLCALDVLINNFDRIPLPVWQNDGNLSNVMVVNGGTAAVGIDQQVNFILQGIGRDGYLDKVSRLVAASRPASGTEVKEPIISCLRQALYLNCGITCRITVVEGLSMACSRASRKLHLHGRVAI